MINLLPPPYQKELGQERVFRLLMVWGVIFGVFLLATSLLFSLVRISLGQQLVTYKVELAVAEKEVTRDGVLLKEVTQWNENIAYIKDLQEDRQSLAQALWQLEEALVPGLNLRSFSYVPGSVEQKKNQAQKIPAKISVTGNAPTRELLFAFRENLEGNALFFDIVFPPSNWVLPADITFSFQANIASEN